MWKLYLKSDEGIAIQSTYNKFKTSIIDPQTVYIGTVNYIDYENEYINSTNILQAFVHKRKSFDLVSILKTQILLWILVKKQ